MRKNAPPPTVVPSHPVLELSFTSAKEVLGAFCRPLQAPRQAWSLWPSPFGPRAAWGNVRPFADLCSSEEDGFLSCSETQHRTCWSGIIFLVPLAGKRWEGGLVYYQESD